jgi:hypothetical protein
MNQGSLQGRRLVQRDFVSTTSTGLISEGDAVNSGSQCLRTSTAGMKGGIPAHIKARMMQDKGAKVFS